MKKLLIFLLVLVTGCSANYKIVADKTSQIAAQRGLTPKIYHTQNFEIYTLQKISNSKENVRIYFEGDGKAFIKRNISSPNPTPTSDFLINLIAEDSSANLVYIARPCQFVKDKKCYGVGAEKYWTDSRFSKEVIDSINEVMMDFKDRNIELIGYSGGANIMKYAAQESQKNYGNIVNLRSIAGNLDNEKFAQIHNTKADLEVDVDNKFFTKLSQIPQIHFVGGDDKTVPQSIAQSYFDKLPQKNCIKIIELPGVSHSEGWNEIWPGLLENNPVCHGNKIKKTQLNLNRYDHESKK